MAFSLTVGAMFSGKSEDQYNKALHLRTLGQIRNTFVFVPKIDTRSKNDIVTHNGKSVRSLGFNVLSIESPKEILTYLNNLTMFVIIDEMQFFDSTIVKFVNAHKSRIEIFGSGLDRTSEDKDFGCMKELIEIADNLKVLCGTCDCGRLSTLTKCIVEKNDHIMIGGNEKYKGVCRICWEK